MSDYINSLLAQADAAQESSGIDMTEAVRGGQGARLLPAGWAFAQLVEVVELGNHPQEFNGKAKDPAMEIQLGFALTGGAPDPTDPTKQIPYNNDDGSPYIMRPYSVAISHNEKARAFLLFKALNWKGTAKSFAQLLSQKWLVRIEHGPKSKTDQTVVSRMDLKSFLPPLIQAGPQAGQQYAIADADPALYKLFLWDRPTLEGWNSLKIEGTYEADENGQKVQKSKNRVQETILSALNFQGSPLQMLLSGGVTTLPSTPVQAPVAPVAAPQAAAPVSVPAAPVAAPAVPVAAAPVAAPLPQVSAPVVGVPVQAVPAVAIHPGIALPPVAPVAPVAPTTVSPVSPIAQPAAVPLAVPGNVVLPA